MFHPKHLLFRSWIMSSRGSTGRCRAPHNRTGSFAVPAHRFRDVDGVQCTPGLPSDARRPSRRLFACAGVHAGRRHMFVAK
jgi:hypothetical protein